MNCNKCKFQATLAMNECVNYEPIKKVYVVPDNYDTNLNPELLGFKLNSNANGKTIWSDGKYNLVIDVDNICELLYGNMTIIYRSVIPDNYYLEKILDIVKTEEYLKKSNFAVWPELRKKKI